MDHRYIFTALTRTSDLAEKEFQIKKLQKEKWATGDYVVCKIIDVGTNEAKLELTNGRLRGVMDGDTLVGVLGIRHATLEATGTWKEVEEDGMLHVLSWGGLLGKLTSKSVFLPKFMEIKYLGHACRDGKKLTMDDFIKPVAHTKFETPVILFIGTSMSSGKTTSARIVTSILKAAGFKVMGGKITGTGRLKDILAVKDVGADAVIDFVDAGLPSSICPPEEYTEKLEYILDRISAEAPDVAVIEIGASPLEPYNGEIAYLGIKDQVKCVILNASDPYAVMGIMDAFNVKPDIVTGISSNTLGGRELVEKLCGVPALNLLDVESIPRVKSILRQRLGKDI
ncbi:DUF1611 domain-containing protein [Salinimicrobium xinjiangense]|uniref:DUF1611 domain-containing protein n=1 Tax=Salinimicrobium xinjiangense TaxID=438596 RepID=UPI0004137E5C|nr:DUF1611 domain-containing protein [Salinimicrobium xinjiangense]